MYERVMCTIRSDFFVMSRHPWLWPSLQPSLSFSFLYALVNKWKPLSTKWHCDLSKTIHECCMLNKDIYTEVKKSHYWDRTSFCGLAYVPDVHERNWMQKSTRINLSFPPFHDQHNTKEVMANTAGCHKNDITTAVTCMNAFLNTLSLCIWTPHCNVQ